MNACFLLWLITALKSMSILVIFKLNSSLSLICFNAHHCRKSNVRDQPKINRQLTSGSQPTL